MFSSGSGMKPKVRAERQSFLSFFRYCTTPSRGLHAGGLCLKATVQKVYGKRKDKDDRVKKNVQEELKEG